MGVPSASAVSERVKLGNELVQMGPRILICPSGFKESLGPNEVAHCIEAGVLRAVSDAFVTKASMVDGGEGFTAALVATSGGSRHFIEVVGPVREPVPSHYSFLGGSTKTAVVEMAAAAGLSIVPQDQRIAKAKGVPVIALAGTVGKGASCNYEAGIDAYASIPQAPFTLQIAIADAERLLIDVAESVTRMVMIGSSLKRFRAPSPLPPAARVVMAIKRSQTFQY